MIRTVRVALAAALMMLPFALATAANAQTCPVLDPSCTVQVIGDGQDAVDDATGSAGDAADDTAHAANDAVAGAQHTVDDTVSTVRDTVDDVLGNGGVELPPGGDTDGGNGGNNGHEGNGSGNNGHQVNGGHGARGGASGPGAGVGAPIGGSAMAPTSGTDPLTPTGDPFSSESDRAPSPTGRRVAAAVIGSLAVMALLLGAVGVFLTIQDRLDRRDPKLVPAALGSDQVRFT